MNFTRCNFAPLMLNAAHDLTSFDRNEDPNLKVFVKNRKRLPDVNHVRKSCTTKIMATVFRTKKGWSVVF